MLAAQGGGHDTAVGRVIFKGCWPGESSQARGEGPTSGNPDSHV